MGHFVIPRQQWLLSHVLVLFKKPHEMYEAVRWRVLLWVDQVVGMKRYIEPGFLANDHCMGRVNIDCCDRIYRENKEVTLNNKSAVTEGNDSSNFSRSFVA